MTNDGFGSGFIVHASGGVVTNAHVVAGVSQVTVRLYPRHAVRGNVVGRDEYLDLAYIRLEPGLEVRPVPFADASQVTPGQEVMTIGFPLGSELGSSPTVTKGIVSSIRKEWGADWLQTDAPVNPGSSGGMLIDRKGAVVGIITSRYDVDPLSGRDVEGVGFALSGSDLQRRIPYLASGGQRPVAGPNRHTNSDGDASPGMGQTFGQQIFEHRLAL